MSGWLAVLLAGAGSYLFRVGAVVVIDRVTMPAWFDRVSVLVVPAVFAALTAGSLATTITQGAPTAVPVLLGAATTVAIARKRSAAAAVVGGMCVLCAAQLATVTLAM